MLDRTRSRSSRRAGCGRCSTRRGAAPGAAACWSPAALIVAVAVAVAVAVGLSAGDPPAPVAPPPAAALALPKDPGMGVACPEANSIACDRIGIAVWLDSEPQRLVARVGGRSVVLRDTHIRCGADTSCPRFYQAMLQPAGLLDGALKVTPDEGRYRWLGRHPVVGTLTITATYRDGSRAVATRRCRWPRLGLTSGRARCVAGVPWDRRDGRRPQLS